MILSMCESAICFLTSEVKIHAALADADLAGELLDRHLFVSIASQKPVGGVEYRVSDVPLG
jgi:hypothetical protein